MERVAREEGRLSSAPLFESRLASLPRLGRGKVRDIYAAGSERMLIVASDRLSAFDVVLPDPIPDKGRVLNQMANFWFERLAHIVPNHLTGIDPESAVREDEREQVRGRSIVVKKLKPLPIEAVVRGYLIGSGWKDYQKTGRVCGIELPKGLQQAQKLPDADLHAGDQGRERPRREHLLRAGRGARRRREIAEQVRAFQHPPLSGGERLRRHERHPHRRHQVRVRPGRERRSWC